MLLITTLGSCRITNPVRRAAGSYPVMLNNARVYGYVHSAAECLQLARFLHRKTEIPPEILPLLAPGMAPGLHRDSVHRSSDVYLAEISSAKDVRAFGCPVQWNHVARHFAGFLGDAQRARQFWALADGQQEEAKADFLAADPAFRALGAADRRLLAALTLNVMDGAALRQSIRALMAELPRVLFVTHCNARLDDGQPIPSRDRFIGELIHTLRECGAEWTDPTDVMLSYGQERAFRKEGGSYTHYTEGFEDALFADWHRRLIPAPAALAG
jgi:hypothetical protein